MKRFLLLTGIVLVSACRPAGYPNLLQPGEGCEYASYFGILASDEDSLEVRGVVSVSPGNGACDTLFMDEPLNSIVCMSSSSVAALSSIGAESHITGVSGLKYISDEKIHRMAGEERIFDIGYESSLDYETLVRLSPDLVVAYTVGESEPPYLAKLRNLGFRVFIIYDHLEQHPLARAEYVRLFGALTGRLPQADKFFTEVKDRYDSLCVDTCESPVRVLMNIPYADAWYVPGKEGYMGRLVRDAGGIVVGAQEGSASGVMSVEEAFRLSHETDIWLCPGYCRTRQQLAEIHHLFPHFGPLANGLPIFNNILRANSGGGNDFWESGAIRPDLILQDLRKIFSPSESSDRLELNYFIALQ